MLLLYLFACTVRVALSAVHIAMFARAIVSLFVMGEENRLTVFLSMITEPFIVPIRFLLSRFRFVQESPIDISFTVAFVVIVLLQFILPVPTLP